MSAIPVFSPNWPSGLTGVGGEMWLSGTADFEAIPSGTTEPFELTANHGAVMMPTCASIPIAPFPTGALA